MRRAVGLLSLGLTLAAIGCGGEPVDPTARACAGATTLVYDPLGARTVHAWPDDLFTVDDPRSSTGLRLHLAPDENIALPKDLDGFRQVFLDLSQLDGFGTTSPLFLRLSGPLDPATLPAGGDGSGRPDASLFLVALDGAGLRFVDVEVAQVAEWAELADGETTLVVTPMAPLEPKTRYALVLKTAARDPGGACVPPSPAMGQLLAGTATDPALARLAPRYADLLARLRAASAITGPGDVSAALVFTTQHTVEDSAAVAADLRKRAPTYTPDGPCTGGAGLSYRTCEGRFGAWDYRVDHAFLDESDLRAHDRYDLPVTVWLPTGGAGPYPTILYGHGLGGERHQAQRLAEIAAPGGFAVVAIDAVKHGDHPDRPQVDLGNPRLDSVLSFFGMSLGKVPVEPRRLRDNFRQSTYDKLQLLELLRPGLDVDGDGARDVGIDQLIYLGVSLGGIMASEFLAFAPEVKVALPIVPGARVSYIIQDGDDFKVVIDLLRGRASDGDVARFFPLLQSAIDRGDSGAYTPHVVKRRLPGFDAASPQLLMQMVIGDTTVPNSTNRFFARGLGVPHVGDELQRIGVVPHQPALPVAGNLDAGHAAGVFQYDVVWDTATACCDLSQGKTEPATHGNVAANPVAIEQTLHFIQSYFDRGVAEIVDPYRTLHLKK